MPLILDDATHEVLVAIDGVCDVVLLGSPPPEGRDLDLLVRNRDLERIESALAGLGGTPIGGHRWFDPKRLVLVDLLPAEESGLPPGEADRLFADSEPWSVAPSIRIPSPAHEILLVARRYGIGASKLRDKDRRRLDRALAAQPDAWSLAQQWSTTGPARRKLGRVHTLYHRPRTLARFLPQAPRRGALIALSGLDGSGKSTQAERLAHALERLGFPVRIVWAPYGKSSIFDAGIRRTKSALRALRLSPSSAQQDSAQPWFVRSDSRPVVRLIASIRSVASAFACVASWHWAARRRLSGGVVIFDRFVLDAVVDVRTTAAGTKYEELVTRMLAPRADVSFFFDAAPDLVYARKPDWDLARTTARAQVYRNQYGRLGLERVDASQPIDSISEEIAKKVVGVICN